MLQSFTNLYIFLGNSYVVLILFCVFIFICMIICLRPVWLLTIGFIKKTMSLVLRTMLAHIRCLLKIHSMNNILCDKYIECLVRDQTELEKTLLKVKHMSVQR